MRPLYVEYPAQGQMRLVDLQPPPDNVGPHEILIHTRYSGITNGTERHALVGEHGFTIYPSGHGYQCVGDIVMVGDEVSTFKVGQTVFFGRYVGHRGYHVVNLAGGGSPLIVPLPDGIDLQQCALLGVAGVGMRHVRRCRIGVGQNVWVIGAGLIGTFVAQGARIAGARVTVSDVNRSRLDLATTVRADQVVDATDEDVWDQLTNAGPFNVIVDAAGMPDVIMEVARHQDVFAVDHPVIGLVAVRGETTFPWGLFHGAREGSIEVSCHFSESDIEAVIQGIVLGTIHVDPLITHHVPITYAADIYELLRDRPGELLGVVFDWSD
jgi:2-desacetyl-2-hydroxyethyl bacteriochlorophyllide A dehydrogenase